MAKPSQITLNAKQRKSVVSMFRSKTKNARVIAENLGVPRHQVMAFLESEGLTVYSLGSYC